MFDIFKNEIKVTDEVKLFLITGNEPIGEVIEIGENFVIIKNPDDTRSRFFDKLIGGWSLIKRIDLEDVTKNDIATVTALDNLKEEPVYKPEEKIKGLTILGKIDLEKIDPKRSKRSISTLETIQKIQLDSSTSKERINEGLRLNSFQQLQTLKEKITIDKEKQIIPANATIKVLKENQYGSTYGFLTDKDGKDYYFAFQEVLDEKLAKNLIIKHQQGVQVVCRLRSLNGKLRAASIFLPKTVEEFFIIAQNFSEKNDFQNALIILEFITDNYYDYEPAIRLRRKINDNLTKKSTKSFNAQLGYIQAKYEINKGNLDNSKTLLLQAIETPNDKSEFALKALAQLLLRESKVDEAIHLVLTYKKLIKSSDPNSLLAYFFEVKKEYKTAISYLEKINPVSAIEQAKLNKRLAIAYFNTRDYNASSLYLKKVLSKQPNDAISKDLLSALEKIKTEGISEEIESIFNEAEISSLSGGLSPFIQFSLARCDYTGVPSSEVSKETFSKRTLKELKKLIEAVKEGRPKERASLYLSEAKVHQSINSENEPAIKASLARYCTSIASGWASDNRNVDTLRYFILEACSLSSDFGVVINYIPMYLHSHFITCFETKSKSNQPWQVLVNEIFGKDLTEKFWYSVLDLLLVNSEFATKFLTSAYQNTNYREKTLKFLLSTNIQRPTKIETLSKTKYLELWNEARENFKREKETIRAKFISVNENQTNESFIESFLSVRSVLPVWLNHSDRLRVNSFDDINQTIREFNNLSSFEDKERHYNIAISQILTLQNEIEENPTDFSFSVLRNLLRHLLNILEKEFSTIIETSKPEIYLKILGEGVIHDNNIVIAQINVLNKKGSAPISWYSILIKNNDGIEFCDSNNENIQSLKGGEDKTSKITLKVANTIREQGALTLNLCFNYKIRGSDEIVTFHDSLTLRLYSEDEFDVIPNPFAVTADSGPVQDEKMFFGRDEFIENIKHSVLTSLSKCVIIYGQKRSGKSSVLYHLKKRLNQSEKAFCISFSLGEIVDDLSALTFYYKVLTEIEDSYQELLKESADNNGFIAPSLSELKEAPAIVFNDYIKKFKKLCLENKNWGNKNLILLLDEFTYIYTAIKKGYLSDQFMKTWKSFIEKGYFTSILIGQDIMPKFKLAYQNEFGVSEDRRLSYLSKEDALKLIEEPIWDHRRNRSRYLGKALDLILDYTSSNPYYIQIFCARLVEYMNSNKAISVTEADVFDVAHTFIKGEQALTADKFDNLITAGDADLESFNPKDILQALKEIAIASKNLDSCSKDTIQFATSDYVDQILTDLKNREVISSPQPGYYKIKVRLFKEWLLNN